LPESNETNKNDNINIPDSNLYLKNENTNTPSKPGIYDHKQPKDTPHSQKKEIKNGNHENSPAPKINTTNENNKKEVLTEININKDNPNVSRTIKENDKQSKKNNSLPNANERTGGCSKCTIF